MTKEERAIIDRLFAAEYEGESGSTGYGITANVYIKGDSAVKVYAPAVPKSEVFREAFMMAYVEQAGVETSKVKRVNYEQDHWVLEMTTVHGVSMLQTLFGSLMSRKFDEAVEITQKMADVHAKVTSTSGAGLPSYKRYAAGVITNNPSLSDECKKKLLQLLEELPDGDTLCHGDLHPNNIIVNEEGKYIIIDWPEVTAGSPCADASRTYVNMCRFEDCRGFLYQAPDNSEMHSDAEELVSTLKSSGDAPNLMQIYLDRYCSNMGIAEEDVLKWIPVQAGMLYGYKEEDMCTYLKPYLPCM